MSDKKGKGLKWKDRLLSSGLPLEYEAAKILASKGFYVTSDYTYIRESKGAIKEFSVDVMASAALPFESDEEYDGSVKLLVECKYSHPSKPWLLLPNPNEGLRLIGDVIRVIDQFSPHWIDKRLKTLFESKIPKCYKGTEINDKKANESKIKRGISQLRYALPRSLYSEIAESIIEPPFGNQPFSLCPILLTTAELYLTQKNFSIEKVMNSNEIEDFGNKTPYLVLISDYEHEFMQYCSEVFTPLSKLRFPEEEKDEYYGPINKTDLTEIEKLDRFKRKSVKHKFSESELPSEVLKCLIYATSYELQNHFTSFLICSLPHFPLLIDKLKEVISKLYERKIAL